MRRIEKRKTILIKFLVLLILLTLPLSFIKCATATKHLTANEISILFNKYGQFVTRDNSVIYNGSIENVGMFGNIIGTSAYPNSLFHQYRDYLKPRGFNFISGYKSAKNGSNSVVVTTMMPEELQQPIVDKFGTRRGCCFCFNYKTGEIYTSISRPSATNASDNDKTGSITNRCYDGLFTPGSTMKIIASLCAIDQDPSLLEITHECDASYDEMPEGQRAIVCPYAHGSLDYTKALGCSCNGYFAKLIRSLDIPKATETLNKLGFAVNEGATKEAFDKLTKTCSSTTFTNTNDTNEVWSLIGQGYTIVNPMDMAMIAGAVANGGTITEPYFVSDIIEMRRNKSIYSPEIKARTLIDTDVADRFYEEWKKACANDPGYKKLPMFTVAKTGTAQQSDSNKAVDSTFCGIIEEKNAAFFIVIENANHYNPYMKASEIAIVLADSLSKMSD